MQQLPSARGDRTLHFKNLNRYQTDGYEAHLMVGKFWEVDEKLYWEFLELLPPEYCAGGFRMIEKLTGSIAATYFKIGDRYWCAYTDREVTEPHRMLNHIARLYP